MKSKIILISIFLIAICLISPIAAEDNSTVTDNIHVSFNSTVYEKDLGDIDVEIPENASGNLRATINDVEFYNDDVNGSVKIPISIPPKAHGFLVQNRNTDHTNYYINMFFNDTLINSNHTLKVMRISPNYTTPSFAREILKDDNEAYVSIYFPESANGDVEIYIDGIFSQKIKAYQFTFLDIKKFNCLDLGNHTVTIVYSGDEYYRRFNKTFNFTVVEMLINIPKNVVLEHDDCISGKIIKNTKGTVSIYVDNKKVFSDKLDQYGEFLHSLFSDVTCGEHLVEVKYAAGSFSYSKTQTVNVSYYVDIFNFGSFIYGQDGDVIIIVPTDFNKKLITITIDSVKQDFEIDNSGWIELCVSRCSVGNHTVEFDFKGDAKYYSYSLKTNFTIEYGIIVPTEIYIDETDYASLVLPNSANGNLELYLNNKTYKQAKLTNGQAEIKIDNLAPGEYRYLARYTGDDFNVSENEGIIIVYPDITTPGDMYCGEDKYVVVKALKDTKGKVIFNVNGKNITVNIKDGKAVLPLKDFKVGDLDIEAYYFGDNGFNTTVYASVFVMHSKIRFYNLKVSSINVKMKVSINDKLVKNGYVLFKIDKKTKKIKTNKYGIVTIALAPGRHVITAYFAHAMTSRVVNVHVVKLKSVIVKKSSRKLVLTASLKRGKYYLKNKIVTFKFNGKTYKAKTNRYGIAKLTIKKSALKRLKVGGKVTYQATYLRDTVKRTATVRK